MLPYLLHQLYCLVTALQVLCGQEGRPSRRRQNPGECEMHGCSDASQAHLQNMLTEFIFGFDSDIIMRSLLQLVCVETSPWLVLPVQSMLSRLIVEHGQVACHFFTFFLYSKQFALTCLPAQLFQLIDIMCDSQREDGNVNSDGTSAADGAERDIVQDVIQVVQMPSCLFLHSHSNSF
jgi:hypothetical protein